MHAIRSALPASAILLSLTTLTSAAIVGRDEVEARSYQDKVLPDFVADLFKHSNEETLKKRQQVGATCYEDPILTKMQAKALYTPWCSAWLDLPALTTTTTTTSAVYVTQGAR